MLSAVKVIYKIKATTVKTLPFEARTIRNQLLVMH